MTKILSLDQSSRTGWAFGVTKAEISTWLFGSFRTPKRPDDGDRLVIFRNGLVELIEAHGPELVAYEEPYFPLQGFAAVQKEGEHRMPFNPTTVKFLMMLRGVLTETTARYGIPTESFTSSAWRVTALGFGRAKGVGAPELKRLMIQKAKSLGLNVKDDNEADAVGILMHEMFGGPANKRQQGDLLASLGATL